MSEQRDQSNVESNVEIPESIAVATIELARILGSPAIDEVDGMQLQLVYAIGWLGGLAREGRMLGGTPAPRGNR